MRTRPRVSWLAVLLIALAIGVGTAATAFASLLYTDWGHARITAILNRKVTEQLAGSLHVERIEALSLHQLTARGVKIIAPNGVPAIEADRAVIDFSIADMWAGHYGWSHADVSGCLVRVTEDASHTTNMEQTFASRKPPEKQRTDKKAPKDEGDVDMRSMVTSHCTLLIQGGTLPELKLTGLTGIMRVHVLGNGDTELRFDRYKGAIEKGLPMGELDFHDVQGEVTTAGKRLLKFQGAGVSRNTPVDFDLDIATQPKRLVKIDAVFPKPTAGSLSTVWVALWSKLCPSVDVTVHFSKEAAEKLKQVEARESAREERKAER